MDPLTKDQLQRQDFVDNAIFDLIHSLTPSQEELAWDIEMIATVRDCIASWVVERKYVCDQMWFYPYLVS